MLTILKWGRPTHKYEHIIRVFSFRVKPDITRFSHPEQFFMKIGINPISPQIAVLKSAEFMENKNNPKSASELLPQSLVWW